MPDEHQMKQMLRWLAAQPDKRIIRNDFQYGNGSLVISQWTNLDMYVGMQFEKGEMPILVTLPFTSITLVDGLGYLLPPRHTVRR